MSEGVVRKIQPFTIGTRLSVPSEAKCQEFVDVYLPKSAAPDKLELHDQMSLYMGQSQGWPETGNSELPQVAVQVYASTPEGHQDERVEEDRNSVSPTASSRSIRKIAICRNAETVPDVSLCDSDLATSVSSTSETIRSNSVHPKPPSLRVEDDLDKISNSQSKVTLDYSCFILGVSHVIELG